MEISYKYRKKLILIKSIIAIVSISAISSSNTNQSLLLEDVHQQVAKSNK
jgi:hypothetical protein